MPRRSPRVFLFALLAVVAVLTFATLPPLTASAVTTPAKITAVSAVPGPGVGEVTFSWASTGASTTSYVVETGLTSFSATDDSLPDHARGSAYFTFPAGTRTGTLTAAQTASAGASVGSANHLYYRLHAVNKTSAGTATKFWPYLANVAVKPAAPAESGTKIRAATYNVRTARATTDQQSWLKRVPEIARSIVAKAPTVVMLQELGPYRADGGSGAVGTAERQTVSLLRELKAAGGSRYKLTRYSPYVKSGTPSSTQGMRILYDANRLTLMTPCSDTTGSELWSASCTVSLPIRPTGDTEDNRRKAAHAQFQDKQTAQRFFAVAAHLDSRRDTDVAVEKTYDALRASQAAAAVDAVAKLNPERLPVFFGADLNTWQNNKVGYSAHDTLISRGFYDTAAAQTQVKIRYTTLNNYDTTMGDPGSAYGARLDAVLVKGVTGSPYWENVFETTDSTRPSDHNMVLSDVVIPAPVAIGTAYQPLTPARVLDTRSGLGAPKQMLTADGRADLDVTGRGGVPSSGVAAVVLNLTATQPTRAGHVTAYPAGAAKPTASTLNYAKNQTVANTVVVKVGSAGLVSLFSSAPTHLLADVQGWFPTGSDLTALTPERILDTRGGVGAAAEPVDAKGTVDLTVTGQGGVPSSGVGSVVVNVTAVDAASAGFVTAYPAGQPGPTSSLLSFGPGGATAGSTVAKVGTDGKITLYASAATHLIVDVQGWFPTSSDLTALAPARVLDTRSGIGAPSGLRAGGSLVDLAVTGRNGVPARASTVLLSVTTTTSKAGYVTVFPSGVIRPLASNLNTATGVTVTNLVVVKVGAGGKVALYTSASTHLIADVVAYVD